MAFRHDINPLLRIQKETLRKVSLLTSSSQGIPVVGSNGGTIVDDNWVPRWTLGISQLGVNTYLGE